MTLGATERSVENVHKHTKQCRQETASECLYACRHCHGDPWQPIRLEQAENGDIDLCTQCHKSQLDALAVEQIDNCIPRHHAENVAYAAGGDQQVRLKPDPDGLKLFCRASDRSQCKVYCVTCHKPMEAPGGRLRTSHNWLLCLRCHEM